MLDARRAAYPPGFFVDSTHLNGRGAIVLSRAVANVLKADLGESDRAQIPRWIALNSSVEHLNLDDLRLEDVERSKRIVGLATNPN